MLYTLLCYHDEAITSSWSEDEEAAVVERLIEVHNKWGETFKPVVRLMPSSTATSFHKDNKLVTDGPFAEMKEQLLGFYVVDVADLEEAHAIARDLRNANPTASYELRPVMTFVPGPASTGPTSGG